MDVKHVGVIGAGTMGHGIAQVFAQAGCAVLLVDVAQPMLDRARSAIAASLAKFVEKGRLSAADRDAALERLSMTTSLDRLADADYIVEAIVEDVAAKRELFSGLDTITRPDVILSSNTSSISITLLGAATKRPDKVLGMHFMNPVPLMQLVEPGRGREPAKGGIAIAGGQRAFLHELAQALLDRPARAIEHRLGDVDEPHREPVLREHLGDPVAHRPRADHADGFDHGAALTTKAPRSRRDTKKKTDCLLRDLRGASCFRGRILTT